ncbi:unnamed protein product, partial [marine sediment metagenome]
MDPALDFIWQNMLLGAIIYGVVISRGGDFWLPVGISAIVALVVSNRMGYEFVNVFGLDAYRKGAPGFISVIESSRLPLVEKIC